MLASASARARQGRLSVRNLREIRILVGSEDELLALGGIFMAFGIGRIYIILHDATLDSFKVSALFFYLEEHLPRCIGERSGQLFDEV